MAILSKFLGFSNGGIKISRLFRRGTKVPRKFGMGVSKFLGYLVGGTRIPYSQGGSKYPRGVHNILGYMKWGCQISWDAKYTVTPD